jgi:hypothetical protein
MINFIRRWLTRVGGCVSMTAACDVRLFPTSFRPGSRLPPTRRRVLICHYNFGRQR